MRHASSCLALVLAASALCAQSYSANELGRPKRFETTLGLTFGSVEAPLGGYTLLGAPVILDDQAGAAIDARFHLPEIFFLSVGAKSYADVSMLSAGVGLAFTTGDGRISLAFEEAYTKVSGFERYWQARLSAGYEHNFHNGLRLGFSVRHIISTSDFLNKDSVTAPVITAGYRFHNGHTLDLSLSNEDYILGSPQSGGALSFGYNIVF